MALMCPREGEKQLLTDLLGGGTLEQWNLKLYTNNYTPAETDSTGSYTEATFTGYSAKALTRSISGSTWQTVTNQAPTGWTPSTSGGAHAQLAHSVYGTAAQTWTCTGGGQTIYGYYLVGNSSSKVIGAEIFGTARTLGTSDTISIQPLFELA